MEQETRARHSESEDGRVDLTRAIIFLAGMYCKLPGGGPDKALENNLCGGDLGDELCRNPYGMVQVFYDSRHVTRDEVLVKIGPPYYAILLEDEDPRREQILLRHTGTYVC